MRLQKLAVSSAQIFASQKLLIILTLYEIEKRAMIKFEGAKGLKKDLYSYALWGNKMASIELNTSGRSILTKDNGKDVGELAGEFFDLDGRLKEINHLHIQSVSVDGKNMKYNEFVEKYGPKKARKLHQLQSRAPDTGASNGNIKPGLYHNMVTGGSFFVSNWGGYWHDDHI